MESYRLSDERETGRATTWRPRRPIKIVRRCGVPGSKSRRLRRQMSTRGNMVVGESHQVGTES